MGATITTELPDELRGAYEAANRVPLGLGVFTFLLMCALGALCLLKPEAVWRFRHLWTVEGGEPTGYAIVMTQIAGIVCVIAGIFCLAAAL